MLYKLFRRVKSDSKCCIHCGRVLQEYEIIFYECSCEKCEQQLTRKLARE